MQPRLLEMMLVWPREKTLVHSQEFFEFIHSGVTGRLIVVCLIKKRHIGLETLKNVESN